MKMQDKEQLDTISIIIPIFNTEKYLNRCLDSVVSQTYANLEIILIDDGSDDACCELCDYYAMSDHRVRIIHKKNGGAADAKNFGLSLFSGDYLGIVDSDDFIDLDMYRQLLHLMRQYQADIVDSLAKSISSEKELSDRTLTSNRIIVFDAEQALLEYMNDRTIRQTPGNKLYKRSVVEGIFFVKGKYIDDEYWTYKAIARCKKYVFTTEQLYYYFQRPGSAMQSAYSIKRLDAIEAFEKRYYELKDKYPRLEKRLLEAYVGSCRFHYQMMCYYSELDPQEQFRQELMEKILLFDMSVLRKLFNGKDKLWFHLFLLQPNLISNIRNRFRIGW